MSKHESYDTHVYVEGRQRPLPVGMYTDEHSEICSIRFSNSFTLNVVSPQDLIELAREIETFAKRAYELHYGEADRILDLVEDRDLGIRSVGEVMAELQQKLEACDVAEPVDDAQIEVSSPEETMMKGTVSPPQWNPNDPVNW